MQRYDIFRGKSGNGCCFVLEKTMDNLQKYSPEFDRLSAQEQSDLNKAVLSVEKFIKSSAEISKVKFATRDAHAKTYATVKAKLNINPDLPEFITKIFNQNSYDVIARFSNGNLVINKKGREMPLYGFSLKIKNIQGLDANFPLVNFPLFPTNSPSVFLKLFTSVNTFLTTKQDNFVVAAMDLPHLIKNGGSLMTDMFSLDVMKKLLNFISHRRDFFLSFKYSGIGCYRIGEYLMKISVKPQNIPSNLGKNEPQKDSINWFLSTQESNFDVHLQLCENLADQPVNDLMKDWKNSKFYHLGTITIPKASFLNSDNLEIENLNFNPFDNSESLQPVGKIQHIRKKIYSTSIETRNNLNFN